MLTTTKMGLTSWNQADDNYDYQQLANNWQLVDFHDHTPGRGVPIPPGGLGAGAVLSQNIAAGIIGSQHLSTALTEDLGLTNTGRGYLNVAVQNTTSSTTFVYMTTQDLITGITMGSNGLILIDYQALVSGIGTVTLVLNGTPIVIGVANGAPAATGAQAAVNSTDFGPLVTTGIGLAATTSNSTNSTEVTTGQILGTATGGGTVRVWIPSGTYSVGVQYEATSGHSISAQNRHLWVRTENFV